MNGARAAQGGEAAGGVTGEMTSEATAGAVAGAAAGAMDGVLPEAVLAGADADAAVLAGGGEMGARMRAFEWEATPVGPVAAWPRSLRALVRLLLDSRHPMFLWWGPALTQFYNDGYRPSLGEDRHPAALGGEGRAFWADAWPIIGPEIEGILAGGLATWHEDHLVPIRRNGRMEDVWWTYGYTPVRGDDGGRVAGVLVTVVETTPDVRARLEQADALARTNAELRTSEAKYRTLFDTMEQGFCLVEVLLDAAGRPADYRFIEANPAFAAQTGLANAAGRTARALVPGLEQHWVDVYGSVALIGAPVRFEQGSEALGRWFDVEAFRVGRPDERRVAILFTDVSAAKTAERERERLLAESEQARADADAARGTAQAANQAKSQFLAVMSHELRTPLNAIGGYAELIELGIHGPVTKAQRTALARIQVSQRHLLGLIAGVLDYSRVEAGAVAYRLTDVPVAEVVAEAELLVAPQLRAKGLGYAWSGAAPGLSGRADREKLQQILLNLLGNAVKFTHARDGRSGRIEVACTTAAKVAHESDRSAAGATAAPEWVVITVRDTGDGIAPEQLTRVFEPFVQVDQRFTRPHDGVGLGLAISRDLARGMGGDLTVESTVGVGSVFTLILPRGSTPGS
ncbi:MAG: ATP-binding protein [Gemmatirosa sp.]